MIGSKILVEALSRGHVVTAISRHPENLPTGLKNHANLRPAQAEVTDTAALTKLFQGQDAIIHAYAPPRFSGRGQPAGNVLNLLSSVRIR